MIRSDDGLILAPLRGVTIRCFRETFAAEIAEAGFTEAVTPFVSAMPGLDPLKDRELRSELGGRSGILVTPQFIGKDPEALRFCLGRIKSAGYETADLNAGCPYPMVRNKGRGSGLLRTPDVLRRMLEVGCETMGEGRFSLKIRLGFDRPDELLKLMPLINAFPLRFLTVHARTARQMYEGTCDYGMLRRIEEVAKVPVVPNGDIPFPVDVGRASSPCAAGTVRYPVDVGRASSPCAAGTCRPLMIGRGFIRYLGTREDSRELLLRYLEASVGELCGDRPVLGRMKELLAYWQDLPNWRKKWGIAKICRSVDELRAII